MNILLPDYDCVIEEGIAEIKNRKLYLYKNGVFKEVMYKITYMLYGDDECYYCHRKRRASPEQKDKKKYFSTISCIISWELAHISHNTSSSGLISLLVKYSLI